MSFVGKNNLSCAKKRMSYTLVFLHMLQVTLPSALGVANANAAELPDLGSSQQPTQETTSQRDRIEGFIAEEAVRLGTSFSSDSAELTTLDKINNSVYKNGTDEEAEKYSLASERAHWVDIATTQAEANVNEYAASALPGVVVKSGLKLDERMQLSGYSFDVLYPFHEDDHNTFFAQSGVRNNSESDRSFFNLGLGHRYIDGAWMLGYNTFFDYELKRGHQRVGIGAEGAIDYFKAAINYYHPLSTWKNSIDIEEHEEMPAKGIDARFKAYLPSYPQIAATAAYEQYFGDDVAMASATKLEKNPYSSSLGVEWTPFPLVTAGVANKWTKGSGSELGIDLNFNVKLGASLSQMLSADQVAKDRLLTGMRHDLVERNNEIVLKYRKKAPDITVSHEPVSGLSGQVIQLFPVVTGGADITSWRWRASSQPGMPDILPGFSDTSVSSPLVTLPLLPIDTLITEYSLYLDVTLNNGQLISSEAIPVVVRADVEAFERRVKIISHPDGVVELSSSPVTVEWVLERRVGDAALSVAPIESNIQPTSPDLAIEVLQGRPTDEGGWINSFTLSQNGVKQTRELLLGQVNIQAKAIASLPLVETTADIVASNDPVHFQNARLEITANNAAANGIATNEVSALVVDAKGAPLADQQVTFSADNSAIVTTPTVTTDAQGVAKTTLTSMVAGQSVVTAQLDNGKAVSAYVAFQIDTTPDVTKSGLTTSRTSIVANGADEATLTLTLKDVDENPLSGKVVAFTSSLADTTVSQITDHGDGTYTATLVGTSGGQTTITATVDGQPFDVSPVQIALLSEVSIDGDAVVGDVLEARCNGGICSSSATYQWQVERTPGGEFIDIPQATASTYRVARENQKKRIQVVVNE